MRNQARMHARNGDPPTGSTADAMRFWPETATAIAVRRTRDDRCGVSAPFGLADLSALVVRPIPGFTAGGKLDLHRARVEQKAWLPRRPRLCLAAVAAPPRFL